MVCCALLKWLRGNSKKKDKVETIGYVPVQGLGESIQLLLAYGNQSKIDVTFKQIQPVEAEGMRSGEPATFPSGQPLLAVQRKHYAHSTAVSRYLGKRLGLAGADPFEDLEIDHTVEAFNDFRTKFLAAHCEPDLEVKQKKLDEFKTEAPEYLNKLDAVIAANNGHLALGKLTWADFVVAGLWDFLKSALHPDVDRRYPHISRMVRRVKTMPAPQPLQAPHGQGTS